jgi:hypothetical protein
MEPIYQKVNLIGSYAQWILKLMMCNTDILTTFKIHSLDEIDELSKNYLMDLEASDNSYYDFDWDDEMIKKLVKKCKLTERALLWDEMGVIENKDKEKICKLLEESPIKLITPKETSSYIGKRNEECKKKKWTMSRSDFLECQWMMEELEEAYVDGR